MTDALVVGASSDIGRAVALTLAEAGYAVHGWGRDEAALRRTADDCHAARQDLEATWSVVDVTDASAMRGGLEHLPDLSVVVWTAGAFDWAPAHEADAAVWAGLLGVNLTAAAVLTALVAPRLVAARGGALVYLGSGAAHQAHPGNAAYVASKHGLAGLARATFLDLRDHDVKVSLVSPGLVAAGAGLTSPAGRTHPELLLQPEDVAAAVRFVVDFPGHGCPTEIRLQPQRDPG